MGVTRKTLSICTFGLVDFRSDKERVARSTRKTLRETRRIRRMKGREPRAVNAGAQGWPTTEVGRVAARHIAWRDGQVAPAARVPPPVIPPPPGWYPDSSTFPARLRWWDGQQWTSYTQWNTGRGDANEVPETMRKWQP